MRIPGPSCGRGCCGRFSFCEIDLLPPPIKVAAEVAYLPFGGLLPRPPPEGWPGFLLGALCGTGFAITFSINCALPATAERERQNFIEAEN